MITKPTRIGKANARVVTPGRRTVGVELRPRLDTTRFPHNDRGALGLAEIAGFGPRLREAFGEEALELGVAAEDRDGTGEVGACHAAILRSFASRADQLASSGTFARTSAAAIGGLTLFPHMRTWACFGSRRPSITGAMT